MFSEEDEDGAKVFKTVRKLLLREIFVAIRLRSRQVAIPVCNRWAKIRLHGGGGVLDMTIDSFGEKNGNHCRTMFQ